MAWLFPLRILGEVLERHAGFERDPLVITSLVRIERGSSELRALL
jgi:hypothetical protein